MMFTERAARAWAARQAAEDWAKWARENKEADDLLGWLTRVGEANG